jgi:SAM-dependent methyltransferase
MPSAIDYWRERLEAHHAQTHRARGERKEGDLWSGLADRFRDDPTRTNDPIVNMISEWISPEKTVLDVGGGAGRYALPFALKSKHVTVVEPSPAMLEVLADASKEAGIENISTVVETWDRAKVAPHDIVFCANVVYGVADIEPFLRKLDEAATEIVAIVVFYEAPLSQLSPLWKAVYQEERIDMPALPELLPVLWEMGIYANVTMMPGLPPRRMPDLDAALALARHMLWVDVGSEEDKRLVEAAERIAVKTPEGVSLRQKDPVPGVVWWRKSAS